MLTLDIPKFFTWFHLILPYVSRDDMSRFLSVWWQWKYRCVPLLAASIGQLIMEGRFKRLDIVLDAHEVLRNDQLIQLHRTCQCHARKAKPLLAGRLPAGLIEWPRQDQHDPATYRTAWGTGPQCACPIGQQNHHHIGGIH